MERVFINAIQNMLLVESGRLFIQVNLFLTKIIFKNGNPIIHLTFMLGESEIPFVLEANVLTLYDFGGKTKKYRKILNE